MHAPHFLVLGLEQWLQGGPEEREWTTTEGTEPEDGSEEGGTEKQLGGFSWVESDMLVWLGKLVDLKLVEPPSCKSERAGFGGARGFGGDLSEMGAVATGPSPIE